MTPRCTCSGSAAGPPLQVVEFECGQAVAPPPGLRSAVKYVTLIRQFCDRVVPAPGARAYRRPSAIARATRRSDLDRPSPPVLPEIALLRSQSRGTNLTRRGD